MGHAQQKHAALDALREKLEHDPALGKDSAVQTQLLQLAGDPATATDALSAMALLEPPVGADLLYEVWTSTSVRTDTTELARALLYSTDVRPKASPALGVALDLRVAETCAEYQAILPKALTDGDHRALHVLTKLNGKRGLRPEESRSTATLPPARKGRRADRDHQRRQEPPRAELCESVTRSRLVARSRARRRRLRAHGPLSVTIPKKKGKMVGWSRATSRRVAAFGVADRTRGRCADGSGDFLARVDFVVLQYRRRWKRPSSRNHELCKTKSVLPCTTATHMTSTLNTRVGILSTLAAASLFACGQGQATATASTTGGSSMTAASAGSGADASAGSSSAGSGAGGLGAGSAGSGTGGTGGTTATGVPVSLGSIVPLFDASTPLEPEIFFDRGDAVVTKWGDRARDRHAREDQFQSYDHYLPHYWEDRTDRLIFVDKVGKGGSTIDVSWVTEWKLDKLPEFRAWYNGTGSVAQYTGNYAPRFTVEGPGTYDNDHNKIDSSGVQYKYTYTITSAFTLNKQEVPLAVGEFMEIEVSQFLDTPPVGRDNYYGTVFLYEVGKGGMVPWYTVGDFADQSSERENSHKLDEKAWSGGRTTLPYNYSDEPENHFMQMATNLSPVNAQPFVRGRRVHHTSMLDGTHDESVENGIFTELTNLVGPNFVNRSCDSCHTRNGRAPVADIGQPLEKWVFKVAAADGGKDPLIGSVLQPNLASGGTSSEGSVSIAQWGRECRRSALARVRAQRPAPGAVFRAARASIGRSRFARGRTNPPSSRCKT